MQLEIALGTLSIGIESGGEDGAAVGTSGPGYGANHARRSGSELVGAARPALRRLAVVLPLFLVVFFRIAVPAMAILSVHKRLRPSDLTDYHVQTNCHSKKR